MNRGFQSCCLEMVVTVLNYTHQSNSIFITSNLLKFQSLILWHDLQVLKQRYTRKASGLFEH